MRRSASAVSPASAAHPGPASAPGVAAPPAHSNSKQTLELEPALVLALLREGLAEIR